MVMHYLYKGGCENLDVNQNDVLELMAAANFFQLDGLLRFCESRCSTLVDLDNIVSMYIHAKVDTQSLVVLSVSNTTTHLSLLGLQCRPVVGILPRFLATKYGGSSNLR